MLETFETLVNPGREIPPFVEQLTGVTNATVRNAPPLATVLPAIRAFIGDSVVVYAQGPIGLCATAGARLRGAGLIIGVDSNPIRLEMAKTMGADVVIDHTQEDPVAKVKALTEGRGADVAIEALGMQETFENCLKSVRPGGCVSSLGVYGDKITVPLEGFVYGIGDIDIKSTLCPGGKERLRALMQMVQNGRLNLGQLVTHRYKLDDIEEAYELFSNQQDGVLKVAITP